MAEYIRKVHVVIEVDTNKQTYRLELAGHDLDGIAKSVSHFLEETGRYL